MRMIRRAVDGTIRCRGALVGEAGVLLFDDDVQITGGWYVWTAVSSVCLPLTRRIATCAKIVEELTQSLESRGMKAPKLVILELNNDVERYSKATRNEGMETVVLDGVSDPEGWLEETCTEKGVRTVKLTSLDHVYGAITAEVGPRDTILLIDSLDALLFRHHYLKVMAFLQKLRNRAHCQSLFMRLHSTGWSTEVVKAMDSVCTVKLQLTAPQPLLLPLSLTPPHGALSSSQTTETGRIMCEVEWYVVSETEHVLFFSPPQSDTVTSAKLVKAAIQTTTSPSQPQHVESHELEASLMSKMDGGMKLDMTQTERDAKKRVILPYENRDASDVLGEIHYVRDSDEEYDSDEDPDDDLDI